MLLFFCLFSSFPIFRAIFVSKFFSSLNIGRLIELCSVSYTQTRWEPCHTSQLRGLYSSYSSILSAFWLMTRFAIFPFSPDCTLQLWPQLAPALSSSLSHPASCLALCDSEKIKRCRRSRGVGEDQKWHHNPSTVSEVVLWLVCYAVTVLWSHLSLCVYPTRVVMSRQANWQLSKSWKSQR